MGNNSVELIGFYGSDESHALSAWTSTSRELTDSKIQRIPDLLKMLADNGHETPFEKSYLHFLVKSDIASHIHLLKHRIGVSINAESARYKELKEDEFYIPRDWQDEEVKEYCEFMQLSLNKYHSVYKKLLEKGFSKKRAKESARFYRPYGTQIVSDVGFNFRSFVHFQRLRNKPEAQLEIADIAEEMRKLVVNTHAFDNSLIAFNLDHA